ncbi:MAG: endolytic transglycosylase MltG [Cypionkella sp.]|nr:endolytic transglycosylase MltG [Cypionkella sp.]
MAKSIASGALTLLVVIMIGFASFLGWAQGQFTGAGPLTQPICFEVKKGANLTRVTQDLAARGAISHPQIFRIGAGYADKAGDVKFGSYLLPAGATMAQTLEAITEGGPSTCGREMNFRIGVNSVDVILRELDPISNEFKEVAKYDPTTEAKPDLLNDPAWSVDLRLRLTLAEGVTSWQVVQGLNAADFLDGEATDIPPEGSLSPDSYEVRAGTKRADILADMTARQQKVLAEAWASRVQGLPYETPEEALTMASIVEKETGVAAERRQVASVFINRIAQGMKLQTDPTVIYGVTNGQGVLGRGLRRSELQRETPYNTYVIDGLPPTPIANPGRASIEAALNPDTTDYLFFVADGTGGHAFAKTLKEHNKNVEAWRKIEADMAKEKAKTE